MTYSEEAAHWAAYWEGYAAYETGGDYGDCPYPEGSAEADAWYEGWTDSEKDYVELEDL